MLKVLRNIAGKAVSLVEKASPAALGRAGAVELRHAAAAGLMSVGAVSVAAFAGAGWSSILPAGFGVFAAGWMGCMALRELWPARTSAPPVVHTPVPRGDVLDLLPGLVTRHDASGQMISAHGAQRRELGAAISGTGSAYFDAVHVSGRICYLHAVDRLRQGERGASAEYLLAAASGEFVPVLAYFNGEWTADGTLCGFTIQTLDNSDATALREALFVAGAEARSANDAKTRFLAAVSHELRTPLNAILGFSDILLGEYFGKFENARQKEYVELVNQSGHHLLAVVNTMLDMSKIEAGRYELIKEPFDIGGAIRAVDEMLGLEASRKGVVLSTRVARGLDEVVADPRAVKQILINLASNAIKFTDTAGVVTIDASAERSRLVITVSDTGIGIAADKLALIGQPFMQVQNDYTRRYEGTGLGLALVKGLVALHGGEFAIRSEEGRGTVITVSLPIDGVSDANGATFEFPPRLNVQTAGETRDGQRAQAKIA